MKTSHTRQKMTGVEVQTSAEFEAERALRTVEEEMLRYLRCGA